MTFATPPSYHASPAHMHNAPVHPCTIRGAVSIGITPVADKTVQAPHSAQAEDAQYRDAYGPEPFGQRPRSAYLAVIGESPKAGADDRETARIYLAKIEAALDDEQLHLTHAERQRLRERRLVWKRRAEGTDPRYKLVGTKDGRLDRDVEYQIDQERKRIRKEEKAAREGWDTGYAKGGPDPNDDDDVEGGEQPAQKISDYTYIVPGTDNKGHSQRIWCKLMPQHVRALDAIKTERKFPFRTIGDIVRWATVRGITELNRRARSERIESLMLQAESIKQILLDEQNAQEFNEFLVSMKNTIRAHMANQAMGEARRVAAMVQTHIDQMPDGYWKGRYLETMKAEYGHLLDGNQVQGTSFMTED